MIRQFVCAATILLAPATAGATVIAEQGFNSLSSAGTANTDSFPAGTIRGQLTNSASMNLGGPGMTFRTFWTDTRGNAGPVDPATENGPDFIGVNSFSGSNAPNTAPDGTPVASGVEHNFEFNDGDGLLELIFDPVDTSGFVNRVLSFAYWINDTGYEASGSGGPDMFMTVIEPDDITTFSFGELELEANASPDDGTANWRTYAANLDTLGIGPSVSLVFGVDTNAGDENVFLDNVLLTGDVAPIPLPASLLLLAGGLGALGLGRIRGQIGT